MSAGKPDAFSTFRQQTIDLRQEMMNKRFDLQRENLKGMPDNNRISQLQQQISAIQARIAEARAQLGLPAGMRDGECAKPGTNCNRAPGMGDCGTSPCGGTPCGSQK